MRARVKQGIFPSPWNELTPEQIFERCWVQTLLQCTFDCLAAEYASLKDATLIEALKDFQPRQPGSLTYA